MIYPFGWIIQLITWIFTLVSTLIIEVIDNFTSVSTSIIEVMFEKAGNNDNEDKKTERSLS